MPDIDKYIVQYNDTRARTRDYHVIPGQYESGVTGEKISPQEALNLAMGSAIDQLNHLKPTKGPYATTSEWQRNNYINANTEEVEKRRNELRSDIAGMLDAGADPRYKREFQLVDTGEVVDRSLAHDLGPTELAMIQGRQTGHGRSELAKATPGAPKQATSFKWERPVAEPNPNEPAPDRSMRHQQEALENAGYETTSRSQAAKGVDGKVDGMGGAVTREAKSHMLHDLADGKLNNLSPELLSDLKKTFAPEIMAMNQHSGADVAVSKPTSTPGHAPAQVASR